MPIKQSILSTNRLILRDIDENDAAILLELRNHPEVNRYIIRSKQETIDQINDFMSKINHQKEAHSHRGEHRKMYGLLLYLFLNFDSLGLNKKIHSY